MRAAIFGDAQAAIESLTGLGLGEPLGHVTTLVGAFAVPSVLADPGGVSAAKRYWCAALYATILQVAPENLIVVVEPGAADIGTALEVGRLLMDVAYEAADAYPDLDFRAEFHVVHRGSARAIVAERLHTLRATGGDS